MPLIEVPAHLIEDEVAHAAPQGVTHDIPLVGDGLPLEATILRKGDGFLRPLGRIRYTILCQSFSSSPGCCDHMICLIAELGRNLAVSDKHLRRSMNLLPVTGVMGGDLRCLRPTETAPRNGFLNLLVAGTGCFKVLSGVALYIGRTAFSGLDLVAQIAEPEGQLRLVDI